MRTWNIVVIPRMLHRPALLLAGARFSSVVHAGPSLGEDGPIFESPTADPSTIVNGFEAEPCQFPSTVALELFDGSLLCSGVLIHPELVLFAAHCMIYDVHGVAFGEAVPPAGQPAFSVDVESCVSHPSWDIAADDGEFDVAYCRLAAPVDVQPVPLMASCEVDALVPDALVTIVGYGVVYADGAEFFGSSIKRYVPQVIHEVVLAPRAELRVSGTDPDLDQSACFGDSGGPALLQLSDGSWRVAGVGSHVWDPDGAPWPPIEGNWCGTGTTYAFAPGAVSWLEADSGLDLTPCYDDDVWVGGPTCGNFPMALDTPHGTWPEHCAGAPSGGGVPVCEPDAGEDGGSSDDAGSTDTGATTDTADGGSNTDAGSSTDATTIADPTDASTISTTVDPTVDPTGDPTSPLPPDEASTGVGGTTSDEPGASEDGGLLGRGCGCDARGGEAPGTLALGVVLWLRRRRGGSGEHRIRR